MRHKAGKHFPTDLLVGTLIGITVPHAVLHFHKNAANKDRAWNLSPDMDFINKGYGLTFNYRFK
jgi:membrane-associated phospholipid phosphatase